MTILEEKHEFERAQAEEERSRLANQNDDYTSLYWNPEGGEGVAKSENEYEVVEENNSNLFGGGILRGIRESLLRELRMSTSHVLTNFENPLVMFRFFLMRQRHWRNKVCFIEFSGF